MDLASRRKVCRLVAGVVLVDGNLDPSEDMFIRRMLERFGLPGTSHDFLLPLIDPDSAMAAMQDLPSGVRHEALALLIEAVCVDGVVVERERDYVHTFGSTLGLTRQKVDERIQSALLAVK